MAKKVHKEKGRKGFRMYTYVKVGKEGKVRKATVTTDLKRAPNVPEVCLVRFHDEKATKWHRMMVVGKQPYQNEEFPILYHMIRKVS